MKKFKYLIIGIVTIFLTLFQIATINADERSELELKKQILMERQGRLIAEFEVARRDLVQIEVQIQKLNAEVQEKEKVK